MVNLRRKRISSLKKWIKTILLKWRINHHHFFLPSISTTKMLFKRKHAQWVIVLGSPCHSSLWILTPMFVWFVVPDQEALVDVLVSKKQKSSSTLKLYCLRSFSLLLVTIGHLWCTRIMEHWWGSYKRFCCALCETYRWYHSSKGRVKAL
jgi:hypothetical protein